jgi:hypothetical protein
MRGVSILSPSFCDFEDCRLTFTDQVFGDVVFPGIAFKAGVLFGGDDLLFENLRWAARGVVSVEVYGLGEEQIAVALEGGDIDGAHSVTIER